MDCFPKVAQIGDHAVFRGNRNSSNRQLSDTSTYHIKRNLSRAWQVSLFWLILDKIFI